MRKRRKRKFSWFPTIGTALPLGAVNGDNVSGRAFTVLTAANGGTTTLIAPLVPDVPLEGDEIDVTAPGQLVQALGQEYYLRRLVGKVFLAIDTIRNPGGDPSVPQAVLIGVGFFVARANDAEVGGGPDAPIGSATPAERNSNYGVLDADCIREPWIWRRTWILSNQGDRIVNEATATGLSTIQVTGNKWFPATNAGYGSVMDGPHIDARTGRRVGNDDRLYVAVSTCAAFPSAAQTFNDAISVSGYIDLRVLGSIRRARGKSVF